MNIRLHNFITLLLLLITAYSQAQTVSAKASLDSSVIRLGDQTHLRLIISYPKGLKLNLPLVTDTLTGKVEVIGQPKTDTLNASGNTLTLRQTYTITSFDSGYHAIPPFEITYSPNGDTVLERVLSNALLLTVNTIPVDTTKAFKDIKDPLDAPLTFAEILPYILWGLLIVLVIIVAIYLYRKLKNKEPILKIAEKPKIPPHIIALDKLKELNEKKLWQQGFVKQYHSELTDIIRQYIEDGLHFPAMEMTTSEIIYNAEQNKINAEEVKLLKSILELADFVKFAKHNPLPNENELSMQYAISFVNQTTPQTPLNNENNQNNNEPTNENTTQP